MIDWWFDWVGYEVMRYKIWYPGLHSLALYEKYEEPDTFSISKYVREHPEGKTKHTIETMRKDGKLQDLQITFVNPNQFGLDTSNLGENQWAICANVKSGKLTPYDTIKAKRLLQEMAIAHKNYLWGSIQAYQVEFEEKSFGFFGSKSSPFKELKMHFSLSYIPKTCNGLMGIKSGKEKGDFWGVQNGKTYKRINEKIVLEENKPYEFSLNTFQYFIEFPSRITEGNIIDYLGTEMIEGSVAKGVIVSWNKLEP